MGVRTTEGFAAPEASGEIRPEEHVEAVEFERGETATNIVFESVHKRDGSIEFVSRAMNRKMIKLASDSSETPLEGVSYDVEIIQNIKPNKPLEGSYLVRVVGMGDAPMRSPEQRERQQNFPKPIEVDHERGMVRILDSEVPYKGGDGPLVPQAEQFSHYTLDKRTLLTIEKILTAVELRQPLMLEGETATSKTSAIRYCAMILGQEVAQLNLNGQTDTSELIGKFIPNDGQLQVKFEDVLRTPELLNEESRSIIEKANSAGRGLTMLESQTIAKNEDMKVPDWRWQDGLDVEAKRKGWWLILDEVNLAEAQILERLNPQLERNPSITLSEHGGVVIRELTDDEQELYEKGLLEGIEPLDPSFGIFSTRNPAHYSGREEMSPAYIDRWTAYQQVETPSESDYQAMLYHMVYGEQPQVEIRGQKYKAENTEPLFPNLSKLEGFRRVLASVAKLQVTMESLAKRRAIGKDRREHYIFTRRGLVELLAYLENKTLVDPETNERHTVLDSPKKIILRGLEYYYVDKIAGDADRQKVYDQLAALGLTDAQWSIEVKEQQEIQERFFSLFLKRPIRMSSAFSVIEDITGWDRSRTRTFVQKINNGTRAKSLPGKFSEEEALNLATRLQESGASADVRHVLKKRRSTKGAT